MAINRTGVEVFQAWFKTVHDPVKYPVELQCVVGPPGDRTAIKVQARKMFAWLAACGRGWHADCYSITTDFVSQLNITFSSPIEDGTKELVIFHPTQARKQ